MSTDDAPAAVVVDADRRATLGRTTVGPLGLCPTIAPLSPQEWRAAVLSTVVESLTPVDDA